MRRILSIGTAGYTDRIMEDNGKLKMQFEDDAGNATIPDLEFRIDSIGANLGIIIPAPQAPQRAIIGLETHRGTVTVMHGYLDQYASTYDPDDESYDLTILSAESRLLARLKQFSLASLTGLLANTLPCYDDSTGQIYERYFASVRDILRSICFKVGAFFQPAFCTIPADWWFGGSLTVAGLLPTTITLYDFMQNVAKVSNAIWFFDTVTDGLWFMNKREFLNWQITNYGKTTLPVLQNSTQVLNKRIGYDVVNVAFAGNLKYHEQFAYNAESERYKFIEIQFSRIGSYIYVSPYGMIPRVKASTAFDNAILQILNFPFILPFTCRDIAQRALYEIESLGRIEFAQTLSLSDFTISVQQLHAALIFGYGYVESPSTLAGAKYFVRSCEIDAANETAKINAIGYDI